MTKEYETFLRIKVRMIDIIEECENGQTVSFTEKLIKVICDRQFEGVTNE